VREREKEKGRERESARRIVRNANATDDENDSMEGLSPVGACVCVLLSHIGLI